MPTVVQFRRGTTAQNNAFTGAIGELSVDTDLSTLRVHDGATAGGVEIVNVNSVQSIQNKVFASHLLPAADSAYDLGDSATKWRDLYLSGNTIYLGDANIHSTGTAVRLPEGSVIGHSGSILDSASALALLSGGSNISYDSATGEISFSGNLDHDALTNFVSDEHVAHSGVTLTAGVGLNGGGTIESSRTFNIDSDELYASFDHDGFNDYVADEHVAHSNVSITAGSGLTGGGTIAATRTLNIGEGTGITVSADAIATNDAEIVHDNLSGFVADEHIAHSGVTLTAGSGLTGGGTIAASRTFNIGQGTGITVGVDDIATNDAEIVHDNLSGFVANEHIDHATVSVTAGSGLTGGGAITASRTLNIGQGTGISVSADAIATNDAEIVHDNLSGFVADEHIAHSGVTLTAGAGLTGGGTIAASRTFNIGAGTGITVNADNIAIGQDVATTADVTFNNITNNGWLDFKHDSATSPAYSEGRVYYSEEYKALTYRNDISDVSLQIGLEEWIRVYNNTGSTITNGTPVYVTGASGETPTIAPADATTEAKARAIGVATHDITNASEGVVTIRGLVSDLDTSALTAGQPVHLGADGSLQNLAPTYPYYPTDLGTVIVSDASAGYIYVNPVLHTYEQFRVTGNQHVDGSLTVGGDLTITGTQSIVSQANLAVDTSFIYTNSGDTIDSDTFTGSGLDDITFTGHYNGTASAKTFSVRIDATGTPDTFEWSNDNFSTTEATGVAITGGAQLLEDGISVTFNATTGHTLNDRWDGTASPVNVDAGFASNRNTGTSGVGYTHMGMFFDVSDEKWKLFKSYDPEPEGTINTGDASYEKATLDANLTGNVTGNLTGAVTGNAATATALATARTIGGVSFNGTSNITLPGVNTTGNQNTTGSAAKLTTARTIGGVSFDGSANISLPGVNTTGNQNTTGSAARLTTARTIGGVSFNGTSNINLPGVNTTGNQNTSGNAATATKLATGRTISLTGDVTGTSTSFDGSGNVSITATIASNSVALGTDTTGNYVATLATGTGLDGSSSGEGGTPTITLDLSELTDMTAGVDGAADELILLDAGAERRKRIGEINLGQFNNDQGWTSNVGDITGVTAGTDMTGGGTSGTVTINHADTSTLSGTYGSTSNGTKIDNITVDARGHVTSITTGTTGDITGVTAGTGLSGGGSSGSVTLNVSGVTSSMFSSPNSLVIYNSAGTALKTIRGPGS